MLRPIDKYFIEKNEPIRSCLQSLREYILSLDNQHITEAWKYGMPMYCYDGKMFCHLWVHKKFKQPYIGIVEGGSVEHPELIQEKRARMKILVIDAGKDLPLKKLNGIMNKVVALYEK